MAELGVGCSPNVACEFKRADFPEGGIRAMRTLRMLLDAGDLRLAAPVLIKSLFILLHSSLVLWWFAAASHRSADS